jgi:hypothetical protein
MMALRSLVCSIAGAVLLAATHADAQPEHALHFLSKQCNEDAIEVLLDPQPLQSYVGSAFLLKLKDGKARLVIVAHNCSQYWMDGEDVGPTQEVQVWVSIQGPEDLRPVIGAEQTLPTKTWFSLFSGSNNPRVRQAKGAAGTEQAPIETVFLEAPGPKRRGEISLSRDLRYSWEVPEAMPVCRLIGMNQDVYVKDTAGNVVLNRIQVLLRLSAGPAPGILTVVGQPNLVPWINAHSYRVSVTTFFPMWSRATLGNAALH